MKSPKTNPNNPRRNRTAGNIPFVAGELGTEQMPQEKALSIVRTNSNPTYPKIPLFIQQLLVKFAYFIC